MGTNPQRLFGCMARDLDEHFTGFINIAEGSNSLVCSATRRSDKQVLAVKAIDCRMLVCDEEETFKLIRELKALQYFTKVKAPCVVRYEESHYNTEDQILYIVTEKMDHSFVTVLDNHGCIGEDEARRVFYETVLITAYEHAHLWVHRDRKPGNLLFSFKGEDKDAKNFRYLLRTDKDSVIFKDCDFGLSKVEPYEPTPSLRPCDPPESQCPEMGLNSFSSPTKVNGESASTNAATATTTPRKILTPRAPRSASKSTPTFINHHSTFVNTTSYKPLETLLREYDKVNYAPVVLPAIDMWANGIFLAEMLIGEVFPVNYGEGNESENEIRAIIQRLPLSGESKAELGKLYLKKRSSGFQFLSKIECENNVFDEFKRHGVSEDGIDLLRRLLDVNPHSRISAAEALEHRWLNSVRDPDREERLFASIPNPRVCPFNQEEVGKMSLDSKLKVLYKTVSTVFKPARGWLATSQPKKKRGRPPKVNGKTRTLEDFGMQVKPKMPAPSSPSKTKSSKKVKSSSSADDSKAGASNARRADKHGMFPYSIGQVVQTLWGPAKLTKKFQSGWNALFPEGPWFLTPDMIVCEELKPGRLVGTAHGIGILKKMFEDGWNIVMPLHDVLLFATHEQIRVDISKEEVTSMLHQLKSKLLANGTEDAGGMHQGQTDVPKKRKLRKKLR